MRRVRSFQVKTWRSSGTPFSLKRSRPTADSFGNSGNGFAG
jgi:hypothetical protein